MIGGGPRFYIFALNSLARDIDSVPFPPLLLSFVDYMFGVDDLSGYRTLPGKLLGMVRGLFFCFFDSRAIFSPVDKFSP